MTKGILGKKVGMTQFFTETGELVPVTVIEAQPNVVLQAKTNETDGYEAIQVGFDDKREVLSNKPAKGHVAKANTAPKRFFKEIRGVDVSKYQLGQELTVEVFEEGEMVDVSGISKGKGFQGVIKRYNQSRGPMGHGSQYHRGVGSLGTMRPMRVFKGKKLPGHMGHEQITIQNLMIVDVDVENNYILVSGNVPGPKNSYVFIKAAIKGDKNYSPVELISYEEVVEETSEETTVSENEVVENNTNEVVNEEETEAAESKEVSE